MIGGACRVEGKAVGRICGPALWGEAQVSDAGDATRALVLWDSERGAPRVVSSISIRGRAMGGQRRPAFSARFMASSRSRANQAK